LKISFNSGTKSEGKEANTSVTFVLIHDLLQYPWNERQF